MTKEGEKRSGNGMLVGILSFLVLVIVGLAVGIVVVNMQKKDGPQEVAKTNEEITDEILDTIRPMNVEDSEKYLDEKLEEYSGTELEFRIKMMKINVYVNSEEFENAITISDIIDDKDLNNKEKMEYYGALIKAYNGVGNEEKVNDLKDKYSIIYNEVFDGGGGGE